MKLRRFSRIFLGVFLQFLCQVCVMAGVKEVRVEAPPYCCSTCEGEEVACGNLARRRRKTRSLSTSSASSSSSEYRLVSEWAAFPKKKHRSKEPGTRKQEGVVTSAVGRNVADDLRWHCWS